MPRTAIPVNDSDLRIIEKMAGMGSPLDEIALVLGWSSSTLDRKLKEDDAVEMAYKKGRVVAKNEMSCRLWDIAMSNDSQGNPTKESVAATIFWLKAQAKWSDRLVVEQEKVDSPQVQIFIPDNGRR